MRNLPFRNFSNIPALATTKPMTLRQKFVASHGAAAADGCCRNVAMTVRGQ